jgi:hypothetical protein
MSSPIIDKIIESLECSSNLSSSTFKHITKSPLVLSCGHSICRDCFNDENSIKCVLCNELNTNKLNLSKECLGLKTLFNLNLKDLFVYLKNNFMLMLDELKNNMFERNLECKIEFIKEEIEIKIESLKNELDLLKSEFYTKLESVKKEIVQYKISENKVFQFKQDYELKLNQLSESIEKENELTESRFFEYQNILRELHDLNDSIMTNNDFELCFKSNDNLKLELNTIGSIYFKNNFYPSSFILQSREFFKLTELCEFLPKQTQWKLVYRASNDGFSAGNFHKNCDNIANTLTLIQTTNNNYIFGGFTTQTWNAPLSGHVFKNDSKAFLFSFKNKYGIPKKFNITNSIYSICCKQTYGPTFGAYDILITDNSNSNNNSFSNFPNSYSSLVSNFNIVNSLQNNSSNDYFLTGGLKHFQVKEIEVFRIETNNNCLNNET